ncbi:hypothetical protein KY314_04875, partial [Candidatus Woesearchaeota archaeon]|nr:hypothetical protein [Candidatus Woesearchaeota archaeon]
MKAIAITNKGIEDICALEIKEILKKDSQINSGFVVFEASEKEIVKLIYLGRSFSKILLVDDFNKWVQGKTFAVRGGNTELQKKIADKILQGKVNLNNPDV